MDADYSVELGPPEEEETLEMPWDSGSAAGPRFVDLRRHPERIDGLEEAIAWPELGEFLRRVNRPPSPLATAKCDAWQDDEIGEAERIYGGRCRMAAYIDLVFADGGGGDEAAEAGSARYSFPHHERLAADLVRRLDGAPAAAAVELIVRRCFYHQPDSAVRQGFYVTAYVIGYGDDEAGARGPWREALAALAQAIAEVATSG